MSTDLTGVGIVVVSFGSHELLERNLASLAAEAPEAHVVVVDNFSSSVEQRAVRETCEGHGWHAVLLDRNTGFGGGVNAGVARARGLGAWIFLIVNPDARIGRSSALRLADRVAADQLTLAAPVVLDREGRVWSEGTYLYLDDGRMGSPRNHRAHEGTAHHFWVSGACFAIGEALWERLGGFDEDYFLYWEDVDLSVRAVRCGGTLVVDREAVAIHDEGGTQARSSDRAKSTTYYYYNVRNRLLFAARHLDDESLRRWRRSSFGAARAILLRGGRRQFLRPVGPLRAAILGTRDGLRLSRHPARDAWGSRSS